MTFRDPLQITLSYVSMILSLYLKNKEKKGVGFFRSLSIVIASCSSVHIRILYLSRVRGADFSLCAFVFLTCYKAVVGKPASQKLKHLCISMMVHFSTSCLKCLAIVSKLCSAQGIVTVCVINVLLACYLAVVGNLVF